VQPSGPHVGYKLVYTLGASCRPFSTLHASRLPTLPLAPNPLCTRHRILGGEPEHGPSAPNPAASAAAAGGAGARWERRGLLQEGLLPMEDERGLEAARGEGVEEQGAEAPPSLAPSAARVRSGGPGDLGPGGEGECTEGEGRGGGVALKGS